MTPSAPVRSTRRLAILAPLLIALTAAAPTTARAQSLEVGGGVHANVQSDHHYDGGAAWSLALAYPLATRTTWLFLEAGTYAADADPVYADATFDRPRPHYRLYPVSLGFRTRLLPGRTGDPLAVTVALGAQILTGRFDIPGAGEETRRSGGAFVELRPAYRVSDRAQVWLRPRFTLLTDATYAGLGPMNFSSVEVQLGTSWEVGR